MKTYEYYKNLCIADIEIILLDPQYMKTETTAADLVAMKEALQLINRAAEVLYAKSFLDDNKASYFASNLIGQLGYFLDKHINTYT